MRVLVITGAGVSAESGIPTFRGKDGYWRNLDPIKLATPEAFARDPELVWQWYRERRQRIRGAQPNAAHEAIAKLAQRADEFLLVTQNVDDLHERAGLPKGRWCKFTETFSLPDARAVILVEAITSMITSRRTSRKMAFRNVPKCDALMRPGVVWFGESLPCA